MHRLWDRIVYPTLCAVQPSVLIEVGGVDGGMTRRLLEYAKDNRIAVHEFGSSAPFDVEEVDLAPGASFVFHEQSSFDALGELDGVDLALLDGGHNWYTVFYELKLLERAAGGRGEAFPVVLVHDTDWPYGRRDAYRELSTVPEEFRHDARRGGVLPGVAEPLADDGLNQHLFHAIKAGGAHNGVLTAVEDFIAEGAELIQLVLPGYHGVTVLASPDRVERTPALAELLKELGSKRLMFAQARWMDVQRVNEQISRGRIDLRLRAGNQQIHELQSLVEDLEDRLDEVVRHEAELHLQLHDAVETSNRATNELAHERTKLQGQLDRARAETERTVRAELTDLHEQQIRNSRAQHERNVSELRARHERERGETKAEMERVTAAAAARVAELEADRTGLEAQLASLRIQLRAAAREQRRLRETLRLRERQHARLTSDLDSLQTKLRSAEDELSALTHRLEVREDEIVERREDLRSAVARQRETDQVLDRITSEVVRVRRYLDAAERSRAWRIGHRISAVFWVLTFRRARGGGALEAAAQRLEGIEFLLDSLNVDDAPPKPSRRPPEPATARAKPVAKSAPSEELPAASAAAPEPEVAAAPEPEVVAAPPAATDAAPVPEADGDTPEQERAPRARWWRRRSGNGSEATPQTKAPQAPAEDGAEAQPAPDRAASAPSGGEGH